MGLFRLEGKLRLALAVAVAFVEGQRENSRTRKPNENNLLSRALQTRVQKTREAAVSRCLSANSSPVRC
jgi:hypothetical protein